LCERCIGSLNLAPSPSYPQCGLTTQGEYCGQYLKSTPAYDTTKVLFSYTFPTGAILQHYKNNNTLFLSQTFDELFSEQLANNNQYKEINLIIAMPLHADRIKERGFNQLLKIAKTMAKQLSISLDKTSCMRIKNTVQQANLPLMS
jgi:predicted amidophosphoribosyltransferase